jgi:hypothetical protein
MHLYEITTQLATLWEATAEVLDAGNTDATEQAIALTYLEEQLKKMEGTHAEKCLNLACLIKNTEAEAEAVKAEETKLSARRKAAERKAEWLRTYLAGNMEPGTNLKDSRAVIGWRKSTAVEVTVKPEELPETLRRTKTIIDADKTAIKAHLEAGQEVPGCTLVQRFNLQIK